MVQPYTIEKSWYTNALKDDGERHADVHRMDLRRDARRLPRETAYQIAKVLGDGTTRWWRRSRLRTRRRPRTRRSSRASSCIRARRATCKEKGAAQVGGCDGGAAPGSTLGTDAPVVADGVRRGSSRDREGLALAMAAFQLYTAMTVTFSPMVQRSVHLAFALCLLYLDHADATAVPARIDLAARCDALAAACRCWSTVYAAVEFTNPGIFRAIDPTTLDIVLRNDPRGAAARSHAARGGASLAIVALVFLVYAFVGPWLPGLPDIPGSSTRRSSRRCTSGSRASSAPHSGRARRTSTCSSCSARS